MMERSKIRKKPPEDWKPVTKRELTEQQQMDEDRYRTQLHASWAKRPGETIVEKAERENGSR